MHRFTFKYVALAALAGSAVGYAQVSCTREGLQAAADAYIAAQTKGDALPALPLAKRAGVRRELPADEHRGGA